MWVVNNLGILGPALMWEPGTIYMVWVGLVWVVEFLYYSAGGTGVGVEARYILVWVLYSTYGCGW